MGTQIIPDAHIAEAAFHIWLNEGQPDGQQDAHWLRAQAELTTPAKAGRKKPVAKKATAAKKVAPKTAAKTPRKSAVKKSAKTKT